MRVVAAVQRRYPHGALTAFAECLVSQRERIPNDAARQAIGKTIGSGEKGVDIVVNRRLKGRRGMCWWRCRADAVVALRLATLKDEWEQRLAAARAA